MTDNTSTDHAETDRHAAMVEAMSSVRPARTTDFPLETVLVTIGALCLPTGLVVILAGWYGVAHTGHLYEQNSYLISGGLFGLGLVFAGGFLYFGYWMTRQIHATNSANQQTLQAISRLEAHMAAVAASTATTPSSGNGGQATPRSGARRRAVSLSAPVDARARPRIARVDASEGAFVVTERGTLLHRPTCPVVSNKEHVRSADPDAPGYGRCRICNPT